MTSGFVKAVQPEDAGMTTGGVAAIERLFDEHDAHGWHPGAHLLVVRHGQIVVDRFVGLADPERQRPVTPDTLWLLFSATKPYVAVSVLKLATEGKIDLDAPVARYWPDFGQRDKGAITVRQVLTHRAGIPNAHPDRAPWYWPSWRLTTRAIARSAPEFPPGEEVAYHALTFGWILGEIVRQVDGRPLDRYVAEEICQPMGLHHTYMRLPRRLWARRSVPVAQHDDKDLREAVLIINRRLVRSSLVPAACGHATVYDHALFYQLLLQRGVWENVAVSARQLLRPEVIELLTTPSNPDPGQMDRVLMRQSRWAHGVSLGGPPRGNYITFMGRNSGPHAFGHGGMRSHAAWGDLDRQLICVYFTNGLLNTATSDRRSLEMSDAILAACL